MTKNSTLGGGVSASLDGILVASLRARAKWPWVRDHLKRHDLKPGSGWGDIAADLAGGKNANSLRDLLNTFYRDVLIAGNKYVQLFDLHDDILPPLGAFLDLFAVGTSMFQDRYPYCLDEGQLRGAPSDLTLCEVRRIGSEDFALVFCSRKDFMERLLFEGAAAFAITKTVPALQAFESIVAMKAQSFQAFDVVITRRSLKRVELLLDLPLEHPHGIDRAERMLKMQSAMSRYVPLLKEVAAGQSKINLFRAIDGMYRDPKGGVLQAIKVRTSTGLVDHLRTTLTSDDLRQNKYHTASATAVNHEIDPFEVTTRLDLTMPSSSVTVKLAAHVSTLAGPADARWLHGLELQDCLTQVDAVRAINRVVSFTG